MSTKLKPFDLEAALRGEPVVTRGGRPVTNIAFFDVSGEMFVVYGVIDDTIVTFTKSGKYVSDFKEDPDDLFMDAPNLKKEGWVVLWKDEDEKVYTTGIHTQEELADIPNIFFKKIAEVKIEWEEKA